MQEENNKRNEQYVKIRVKAKLLEKEVEVHKKNKGLTDRNDEKSDDGKESEDLNTEEDDEVDPDNIKLKPKDKA